MRIFYLTWRLAILQGVLLRNYYMLDVLLQALASKGFIFMFVDLASFPLLLLWFDLFALVFFLDAARR